MKRKITIIGTGYVGLTTGICFAYLGHNIICVDKDKDKIEGIKKGVIPIYEPGLEEILKKHRKNISFTTNLKKSVQSSEIVFVCVGTPARQDGSIELGQFKTAIKEIARYLNGRKIIVNKSTVPVGTGDWTKKEIKKYFKGHFSVVSNPEFLREGSAVKDSLEPDRIVIGTEDENTKKVILDIYSSITAPKLVTDIRSAELIKYAANAFLATKISFINEIANLCERTGGDVKKVAEGIGLDKRIGKSFLNAGIGYGGSCFPKDISGLIKISDQKKYNFKLIRAVAEVNEDQQKIFVEKIIRALKKNKGKVIGVWGLSFKPNTDDIRKSPAIEIIKSLGKKHYCIQAYDPVATNNAKKQLVGENIRFCETAEKAAENADVLALVTEWPEFSEINMKKIRSLMRKPYFFDGRNQFDPKEMREVGFYYEGIGRK